MNVLKYLNSMDARAYLEKLGYSFVPLDAAKIIDNCEHIDLEEKHRAFSELIASTEDEIIAIPEEYECDVKEISLHTLLNDYIEAENHALQSFESSNGDFVYLTEDKERTISTVHRDYKKELQRFMRKGTEEQIVFTKINFSKDYETVVCYDRCGRVLWVHDYERFIVPYTVLRFDYGFSGNVPSPFTVGDVVISSGKYDTHPLVITAIEEKKILGLSFRKGRLIKTYLYRTTAELQYYPEKDAPILKAVSDYVKGKTDLCTFINSYHGKALESHTSSILRINGLNDD
ncbi:MAG: hypothetical protein IJ046_00840 [Clostridia bacterium]|nr:hypothetical protein [Clostridia bacterium]